MDEILSKLSEIEESANHIMDRTAEQKNRYAEEMKQKTEEFDRQMQEEAEKEVAKVRSQLEQQRQEDLAAVQRSTEEQIQALEEGYEKEHTILAKRLMKQIAEG